MTTDDPMTPRVPADGATISDYGAIPTTGPGGDHGRPALDDRGRRRCCRCLILLKPVDGGSVYCRDCKAKAKKEAAGRRNANRREAEESRKNLRQDTRWEGDGYTRGREGLYLDKGTVNGITEAYGAALAGYATWADLAQAPFNQAQARTYHQALGDMLRATQDLNEWLRGPLFPHTDRRASRRNTRKP